jgi:hypothetical protein
MQVFDMNGREIKVGDDVMMPEPNGTDIHCHEFVGYVNDILDNGNLIIEDGDSDFFEIEPNRVEVQD